ncbi:PAS domain S-box protein [Pontibacter harenae]|uniref:PAS domain S-box protein n=1 Tax=Pontibacter harenae TaxID=2894083 RepID=UPI001E57F53A|nr:PAS domain S-box protein [Pontibacter harenae]MCC9166864.1 PAS domain S-box protein [Pontibacter harenae]
MKPLARPALPEQNGKNKFVSVHEQVKETIFASFNHPYVVINSSCTIVEITGDVRPYLSLPNGDLNGNIVKMVNRKLQLELQSVIDKAIQGKQVHQSRILKFEFDNQWYYVKVSARPLVLAAAQEELYLLIFEKQDVEGNGLVGNNTEHTENHRIQQLEQEVALTKSQMQEAVAQLERANEKLKALNEELRLNQHLTYKLDADQERQRNKEEISKILDSIADGFYALDQNWNITYWNSEVSRLHLLGKEDVVGRNFWEVFPEALSFKHYTEFHRAIKERIAVRFQEFFPPSQQWFEVNAYPSDKSLSVYFRDVTEQRRVTELDKLGRKVLAVNALPNAPLKLVITKFLAGLEKIHPGMLGSFMQLEERKLYPIATPSLCAAYTDAITGLAIGDNAGSCGTAAFLKEKVIVTDIDTDQRWEGFRHLAQEHNLKACWSFPILNSHNTVLGTFVVYYKEPKAPSPAEERSLASAGNLLQVILENKIAEDNLRISNERYVYATLATHEAIWDWDLITNKIYWGPGFDRLFGYDPHQDKTDFSFWQERVHPDDVMQVVESLENTFKDEGKVAWQEEYRYRRTDGSYTTVQEQGYVIRDEGKRAVRMVGVLKDISQKKLVEEELRRLSLIARETINGVILMDATGAVLWINDAFTRIFGYELSDVIGKRPGIFLNGEETDDITKDYIREQFSANSSFDCEIAQYSKSGKRYWIRMQVQPIFNNNGELEQYFALQTDITRQKEEEQQLRLLESGIMNANDSIIIAEPVELKDGRRLKIVYANAAFTKMTGYSADEVLGHSPRMLVGPESDEAEVVKLAKALEDFKPCELELILYKKSGEPFWSNFSALPIPDKSGVFTHWIVVQRDTSERKKYEVERELMIQDLIQSNADLKQFSYITSHNLRSPLSNLLGIVKLLDLSTIHGERNLLLIEKFKESTVQLNRIVNDLLEILIIKNNINVKTEKLGLRTAFSEVITSVESLLQEVNGSCTFDFSQGDEVFFNPGYLHSILLNLLTNSIKYRSGERKLQISVSTEKKDGAMQLNFTDNGLGIDLNRYGDRIFGLYQRFHNHPDSKGLGLYITHTQMIAMGGNILVESEVNKGTTFTLQFSDRRG